ncbi:hypothetical protein H920_17240 [Fukomys damarensis]|uniref:Uncharacterized protein n=1 Tax=Fukomys damarensis TaxID=885580 RepID=A0A091DEW4_FUKDA|nr:hypothetical protein H920_17240 [Fukomys damarensis]
MAYASAWALGSFITGACGESVPVSGICLLASEWDGVQAVLQDWQDGLSRWPLGPAALLAPEQGSLELEGGVVHVG